MANIRKEKIGVSDWIKLFLQHRKYWHDYNSSTVLTDPQYNIIAFFDRWTENIDRIEIDIPFNWGFIISNWKGIETKWNIKYKPYDFEMARKKWKNKVKEFKINKEDAELLWKEMKKELNKYNTQYFNNLKIKLLDEGIEVAG